MAHTIYPEFWTNCWSKDYLCYDIKRMCSMYKDHISKLFENPERSADNLKTQMLKHPGEYWDGECDEADFAYRVEECAVHEYGITKDMQYRTRLLWICCILELWEQNLSRCITQDLCNSKFSLTEPQKNSLFNGFRTFENIFSSEMFKGTEQRCILSDFPRFDELKELSLLVNAIKHGRGKSLNSLYKHYPKYKMDEASAFAETTIYTQTLNVSDDDFYRFCDVLIDFWIWLPTHIVITNIDAFRAKLSSKEKAVKNEF